MTAPADIFTDPKDAPRDVEYEWEAFSRSGAAVLRQLPDDPEHAWARTITRRALMSRGGHPYVSVAELREDILQPHPPAGGTSAGAAPRPQREPTDAGRAPWELLSDESSDPGAPTVEAQLVGMHQRALAVGTAGFALPGAEFQPRTVSRFRGVYDRRLVVPADWMVGEEAWKASRKLVATKLVRKGGMPLKHLGKRLSDALGAWRAAVSGTEGTGTWIRQAVGGAPLPADQPGDRARWPDTPATRFKTVLALYWLEQWVQAAERAAPSQAAAGAGSASAESDARRVRPRSPSPACPNKSARTAGSVSTGDGVRPASSDVMEPNETGSGGPV